MELGGKSAAVVLEDACLEHAVEAALAKTCQDSGQTCTALTRLVGPAGRLAEAEKIAADVTASCRPGDPLAPEADRIPIGGLMGTAPAPGAVAVCGRFQSRMAPSRLPLASVCPPGLSATDGMPARLAGVVPSGRGARDRRRQAC